MITSCLGCRKEEMSDDKCASYIISYSSRKGRHIYNYSKTVWVHVGENVDLSQLSGCQVQMYHPLAWGFPDTSKIVTPNPGEPLGAEHEDFLELKWFRTEQAGVGGIKQRLGKFSGISGNTTGRPQRRLSQEVVGCYF